MFLPVLSLSEGSSEGDILVLEPAYQFYSEQTAQCSFIFTIMYPIKVSF